MSNINYSALGGPHRPDDANWPAPTPKMLKSPQFKAIYNCIKSWDVNVPEIYSGYCGATGNHARAIYDALGLKE